MPNEEFSDDTTPSVARKFLNEVKGTIVTLQRVIKQKMTLDIHNWSSSVHQEIYKIIKDEIFPIINQVDARLQNFEIEFLKEAVEFVRDFKYLANEADESLAKHRALELEIERLLRAIVSQDILSIVQISNVSTQVNAANSTNIDNLSDAVICAFFYSQPNSPQLIHEDLQQIYPDDMEEMDLRWKMAMLTMRAKEGPNYALMAFSSSNFDSENVSPDPNHKIHHIVMERNAIPDPRRLIVDNCKKGLGYENYNVVPPPYTGNFMPLIPDLSFTSLDEFVNEPVVENCKVSDDEEEDVSQPKIEKKTVRPSIVKKEFIKSKQQEKTNRKTVKQVEQHRQNTHSPRGNQRNWNNMMSQKLGSNYHLQDQGVINSGCSRHMTGNMSYLTNYKEIDRRYVAFGGNPKGGKITGKDTIKTGN
ncbi:hypothetical protein Tco_0115904 [Tanacetum coccineum]